MNLKRYNTDYYKLFVFELVMVFYMSIGVIERTFAFLLLALTAAFFLTKPFKESLKFFLVSLPLFVALPFLPKFDSMSIWRPLSGLLVLVWLWERKHILWDDPLVFWEEFSKRKGLLWLSGVAFLFLFIATLSLLWAQNILVGVKTILYFVNIFLVFFMYAWEIRERDTIPFLAVAAGMSAFSLLIGFLQFAGAFFIPLFEFWQWWASLPIMTYYGSQTSHLLSYSNTWFSYYGKNIPATLRIFSIFQDSHAFAMFSILGISAWGAFFLYFQEKKVRKGIFFSFSILIISILAIILSGSRGSWLGAGGLIFIILFLLLFPFSLPKILLKKGLLFLIIFLLLFPLSSLLLAGEQKAQLILEGRGNEAAQFRLAFLRAYSTFDANELSNKGRLEIWKDSFRFLKEKNFLTGAGIGNFPTVIELRPEKSRLGASAHSLYLQFLVELGAFGFLVFLAILFFIIKQAYNLTTSYYAFCFLFAFSWALIYSIVDVTLLNDKVLLYFAILTGILYAQETHPSNNIN